MCLSEDPKVRVALLEAGEPDDAPEINMPVAFPRLFKTKYDWDFAMPRAGEKVDEAEIAAHCASRLVNYKSPSEVRVIERLPMTAAGKPDRIALTNTIIGNPASLTK